MEQGEAPPGRIESPLRCLLLEGCEVVCPSAEGHSHVCSCIQMDVGAESSKCRQCGEAAGLEVLPLQLLGAWGALQGLCSAGGLWVTQGPSLSLGKETLCCPSAHHIWQNRVLEPRTDRRWLFWPRLRCSVLRWDVMQCNEMPSGTSRVTLCVQVPQQ